MSTTSIARNTSGNLNHTCVMADGDGWDNVLPVLLILLSLRRQVTTLVCIMSLFGTNSYNNLNYYYFYGTKLKLEKKIF